MTIDLDTVIGFVGVTVGLFGLGYAVGANKKMKEVSEVVGKSVDSMISDGKLDIPKELINETIKERVNAVDSTYRSMEVEAKEKIRKEIRNIDISGLKREVKAEAKEAVTEKLQSSMDDILETYNSNLANVQNIYSTIAKSMAGRA